MSCIMKKSTLYICENKKTQISCAADQRLCFRFTDSTIHFSSKIWNFKLLAFFRDCRDWLVSYLVGNPEDQFSCKVAHMFQLPVGLPPVLPDIKTELEKFLTTLENIPVHDTVNAQK